VYDTARADIFHELRHNGDLPTVQKLAEEGTVYPNATSNSSWTVPSHASMFSGERVNDHQTHNAAKNFTPTAPALAEQLNRAGYATAGMAANSFLRTDFGFDRGFDTLASDHRYYWGAGSLTGVRSASTIREAIAAFTDVVTPHNFLTTLAEGARQKLRAGWSDSGARHITERSVEWLTANADSKTPFFYFINYLEPHIPYEPPKSYVEDFLPKGVVYEDAMAIEAHPWKHIADKSFTQSDDDLRILEARYKGALTYLDDQLSQLCETLRDRGEFEDTVIIVVGDHGENIGDHGLMDHQYSLHQSLINVPLIINGPRFDAKEDSRVLELRDLYPTLLDVAGVSFPEIKSVSTHTLCGPPERSVAIAEYQHPRPTVDSVQAEINGE